MQGEPSKVGRQLQPVCLALSCVVDMMTWSKAGI